MNEWDESFSPQLRTMQIIAAALSLGASSFLGIVLFLHYFGAQAPPRENADQFPLLLFMAIGFCLAAIAARAVVPSIIDAAGRRRLTESATDPAGSLAQRQGLLQVYQTRLIVAAALLEGAAFFSLVAFMTERQWPALWLAVAMIIGIVLHIPSRARVQTWLALQQRLIREERSLGGR